MADLKRWYTLREEARRARREVTTAAQIARSTVPVTVRDEDGTEVEVDVPIPDLVQEGVRAGEQSDEQARVPGQVTGLELVSNTGSWGALAEAVVVLAWDPVTTGADGAPVAAARYEVLDGDVPVGSTEEPNATLTIPSGTVHEYRVRAVTPFGVAGDPSEPVQVTGVAPALVPLDPTPPTLSTGFSVVVARWDGAYTAADGGGAHEVLAEVYRDTAWARAGTGMTGAGTVTIPGTAGQTMQVRLAAYDRLGRRTGVSAVAEIVVAGVQAADLDAEIKDALAEIDTWSEAVTLASGKLTLADRAPAPADGAEKPVPALWMQHSGGSFSKLYEWNGTQWTERPLAEEIIPKVAIGSGTYGELSGDRLSARSVKADKVLITSGQNEVWDGNYLAWDTPAWWNAPSGGPGSGWVTDIVRPGMLVSQKLTERTAPASTAAMYSAMRVGGVSSNKERLVSVSNRVGEKLVAYSHWYVDRTPPAGLKMISSRIYFYNEAGVNFADIDGGSVLRADVVPGKWFRVGGKHVTVPEGALYAIIRPTVYYTNNTTAVNGTVYYLGGEEMYWANAGELLVDGAVLARHVQVDTALITKLVQTPELWAGRVKADFLEPAVGDKLYLGANSAIEMIVQRQDDTDTAVAGAAEAAAGAQAAAEAASDQAGTAQGAAEQAAATAASAALVAEEARTSVDGIQAVFRVLPGYVEIATVATGTQAPYAFRVYPNRAQIVQGTTVLSEWNGGQLIVNETVLNRVQIGTKTTRGHQIEQKGVGRTVIRPIT